MITPFFFVLVLSSMICDTRPSRCVAQYVYERAYLLLLLLYSSSTASPGVSASSPPVDVTFASPGEGAVMYTDALLGTFGMPPRDTSRHSAAESLLDSESQHTAEEQLWEFSGFLCAVKTVQAKSLKEFRKFAEEVQMLQKLSDDPHVVEIYDAQMDAISLRLSIVMELTGGDFAHWMSKRSREGRMDLTSLEIARFAEQILAASVAVHEKGIMHCDLKPQNLLVARRPKPLGVTNPIVAAVAANIVRRANASEVSRQSSDGGGQFSGLTGDADEPRIMLKLCDFGVATRVRDLATHLTADDGWGTAKYMAPEMVRIA